VQKDVIEAEEIHDSIITGAFNECMRRKTTPASLKETETLYYKTTLS
jgi:hypothetical protein